MDSRTTRILIRGTGSVSGDGTTVAVDSRSGVPDGARTGLGVLESEINRGLLIMLESGSEGVEGITQKDGSAGLPSKRRSGGSSGGWPSGTVVAKSICNGSI